MSRPGDGIISGTLRAGFLSDGARSISVANLIHEDPPFTIDIISKDDNVNWQLRQIDLGPLCDDEDGCTVRVYLQHERPETGYETRFVEEKIILERNGFSNDPDLTANPPRVKGRGLQIASDETHIWGRRFTFGDNSREVLWEAWDWIWTTDYRPGARVGDQDSDPETGANKFKIWIALHPHVSARVIIYDR